jgi:hypothetical protein
LSVAKGVAAAAVVSTILIVLFSGRGDRTIGAAVEEEETRAKVEAEAKPGKRNPVEFWLGDQRIETREQLDAAIGARREKTKDYYLAAYEDSEDFRRRQIEEAREQFDRDRVDEVLEEEALTEEEISRMEREEVMIW